MTNNSRTDSNLKPKQRRLPAEWEPAEAVLVAWPHEGTDWAYMLEEVRECYVEICRALVKYARVIVIGPAEALDDARQRLSGCDSERITLLETATNDTWTRDYGAITVDVDGEPQAVDFKFNGWGLKFASCLDNMATSRMADAGVFARPPENRLSFVLEGGSIESDGRGLLLTTGECLLSPNRNGGMTEKEIENYLTEVFGLKKVLWLSHGALRGDDTDSHIDTLARLAPPGDVIFYTGCSDPEDEHYHELKAMGEQLRTFTTVEGHPFNLLELPLPDAVYDPEDGSRLPATYANFLIVNGAVLMPTYGQPLKDRQALDTIAVAMPEYDIIGIDCRALIRQHGSLHCATMQIPVNTLK